MEFLLVGIGGIFGSLTRFALGRQIAKKIKHGFPIPTFIINISGAMLLGAITSLDTGRNIYLLAADGFLGAYTTFSTFMYEGFNLFSDKKNMNACVYIAGSIILGICGYVLGWVLCSMLR